MNNEIRLTFCTIPWPGFAGSPRAWQEEAITNIDHALYLLKNLPEFKDQDNDTDYLLKYYHTDQHLLEAMLFYPVIASNRTNYGFVLPHCSRSIAFLKSDDYDGIEITATRISDTSITKKAYIDFKYDYAMNKSAFKAYLAGSIFYHGDLLRNQAWASSLRECFPNIDLYSPVENTDINGVEGKKKFAGSKEIADGDNKRLNNTDILIACIDGDVLPSGTCAEIGKFHEKWERGEKKLIVGICTDNRQMHLTHSQEKDNGGAAALGEQQYSYQNLYVTGLIKQAGALVSNIDDAKQIIDQWLRENDFKEEKTESKPTDEFLKEFKTKYPAAEC